MCKSLPRRTIKFLDINLATEYDERTTPGFDPESRKIMKALFDASREQLGFWNFLHFFRFRITSTSGKEEEEYMDLKVMTARVFSFTEDGEVDGYGRMDLMYYS